MTLIHEVFQWNSKQLNNLATCSKIFTSSQSIVANNQRWRFDTPPRKFSPCQCWQQIFNSIWRRELILQHWKYSDFWKLYLLKKYLTHPFPINKVKNLYPARLVPKSVPDTQLLVRLGTGAYLTAIKVLLKNAIIPHMLIFCLLCNDLSLLCGLTFMRIQIQSNWEWINCSLNTPRSCIDIYSVIYPLHMRSR